MTIYRGFEIENRADGFYAIGEGEERGPFARDDKAMDFVDAFYRARRIDADLAARTGGE